MNDRRNRLEAGDGPDDPDELIQRLSALPRPVLRDDAADRIRTRVLNEIAVSAPMPSAMGRRIPNFLRALGGRPALAGGGLLAAFPLTVQVVFAASLLSVAVWMVARDVQAFPALPWQSPAALQSSMHCGIENEQFSIAPETLPLRGQQVKGRLHCPSSLPSASPKAP